MKLILQAIKNKHTNRRTINHLKYLFAAIVILSVGIWDFIGNYEFTIYPIGPATSTMFLIIVTIAIIKHQLMDITVVIKRGIVYSFLISTISLIYLLVVISIEQLFHTYIGHRNFTESILTASLIAIIFIPLKNKLQDLVDKTLFNNTTPEIVQENKLLRQEIIQTERLKSIAILASGIAHEIKNPLTPLKTFSEYLPKKLDDQEFLLKFSPIIKHSIDRINSLVHELLDFAKPTPVNLRETDLHPLLEQILILLSNDFLKRKIGIIKDYRLNNNQTLLLDTNQFKQALLNLILNAMDAMPEGGNISISTNLSSNREYVVIKIQDSGIGISSQDIPHIFDPFFTKKDHGTGLGLSITHEIIKNHNGRIFVESKPNCGSTFIIELPYNSPF